MTLITIPKKLLQKDDLIVVPRREYEALLKRRISREFAPTAAQKRALKRAMGEYRTGKTLPYDELVRKLGFRN